ncbi:MAG: phosphatase PAP2 family protein [Crocinitomicaceae bacterium]
MKLFKAILPFMAFALLFIFTGLILVFITDKFELHVAINQQIGEPANSFFKYFTHIGDGLTAVILIVIAALFTKHKIAYGIFGLATLAISGLLAQLFKRQVFSDVLRPSGVFKNGEIEFIQGVDLHAAYSFPSGHSTASFALFVFLAFVFRKKRYAQAIFAICAILAAYSRVHISQHFTEDIVAGACLGILTFFGVYYLMGKINYTKTIQVNE